ncbi:MAG: hypothetical protein H6658_09990 [Ardenticatenaceae bacterium]|nr:hypothetical protein [Ardenticatenaceae bacterium]
MMRQKAVVMFVLFASLVMVSSLLAGLWAEPVVAAGQGGSPVVDQRDVVKTAVYWLILNHQNDDGGYSTFSGGANMAPSDPAGTLDAMIAIAAAGYNPAALFPGKENTPIDYLQSHISQTAEFAAFDGAQAGKVVLGLVAANQNPTDFAGHNFVISVTSQLSPTGQYGVNTPFKQAMAILALTAVHEPVSPTATQWLLDQQISGGPGDGGWNDGFFTVNGATDDTALAMMALVRSGTAVTNSHLLSATDFLSRTQLATGGWEYEPGAGFGESANSTALAVQALSIMGENFYADWAQNGTTPLDALLGWRSGTGAFQADYGFGRFDDFYTTVQAIPGATGKAYPVIGRYEAARRGLDCLDMLQDQVTGGWEQFAGVGVNAGGTARAIEAIAAFGEDPQGARWTTISNTNAVEALAALTPAYLAGARGGRTGVVMQGVVAGGAPFTVTNFAGLNLPLSMTHFLSPTGEYDHTSFGPMSQVEAMLGLWQAGFVVDETAVTWLLNAHTNGNWGDPDANGISLNILGRMGIAVPEAIAQLRAAQLADGGWGFAVPASPSSSSEVVQGLIQQGQNPFAPSWSQVISGAVVNVADTIVAQQDDSGCWLDFFGTTPDPFSTTDAILLLRQTPEWPEMQQVYLPLVVKN